MEDILPQRIASHSISRYWNAAAETGRPKWRSDPADPFGTEPPFTAGGVTRGQQAEIRLSGGSDRRMRGILGANHITASPRGAGRVQTLLSGAHLSGGGGTCYCRVTRAMRRNASSTRLSWIRQTRDVPDAGRVRVATGASEVALSRAPHQKAAPSTWMTGSGGSGAGQALASVWCITSEARLTASAKRSRT